MEDNKKEQAKEEVKDNRDCNFVYFIDTHEKAKTFKISLSPEYEGQNTLEKIKDKDTKNEQNELTSEVYRFKIIPGSLKKNDSQKYEIFVFVEDEKDKEKEHQYSIKFSDEKKDIYDYDFNIEEVDIQPLSHEEQFEIYVEILRKQYNKRINTIENEDLMASTELLIDGDGKKFNFFFYLLIFLECYKTKYIQQHLLNFKPEKIEGLGNIPDNKIKYINNIFKIINMNPAKALNIENAKNQEELVELLYSIILYFNMNFQKNKVLEMFNDDKILSYLSKKLISFHDLYKELILPKNIVRKLITKAKTFNEILGFLYYIGKDIIEFLELIFSEIDYIKKIFEKELDTLILDNEKKEKNEQKKMERIIVDKYIKPKKEDDFQKIYEKLGLIYANTIPNNLDIITFSNNIFEQYVDFYHGKDLTIIQLINKLIDLIKSNDKSFEFKYNNKDMNGIIHDTGIELINFIVSFYIFK